MYSVFIVYLICCHIFYVECFSNRHVVSNDFQNSRIIVTASAIIDVNELRELRIHWNHPKFINGDSLALYEKNPKVKENVPIIFHHPLTSSKGFVKTGVKVSDNKISSYYAAILRRGKIQKTSNTSSKSNWMEEKKSSLRKFTIPQLFIPGTHGSGNYYRPSDNFFDVKVHAMKWAQTQDYSIKQQLEHGIRYLDIRPAWDKEKSIYYVNHAVVEMIPMSDVINEIDEFLNKTKEIVIISFKEFPRGFSKTPDHEKFALYIETSLSRHLQPYNFRKEWRMRLNRFWKTNKRLIIAYDCDYYRHPTFWPKIPQNWGNCRDTTCLRPYLQSLHNARPGFTMPFNPHADMVELTHDTASGIYDALSLSRASDLRKWADNVGLLIPQWYDKWNSTTNIVAVDFFQSSGVVDLAIYWNERRANTLSTYKYRSFDA